MAEDGIKCCDKPLEFILQEGESWQAYIPKTATCKECDIYYEIKPGKEFAYKQTKDGYMCTNCGETIMIGRVAHAIWDGPFPMSGSGRCNYERVPYCPKCEEKPNFHGTPIEVGKKVFT